jgi:hypothetical protein
MQYYVVMIDYGRRGREAVVDPEITRREVVSRVASGEYRDISFIHEIAERSVEDVTEQILSEAALPEQPDRVVDLQADRFDHAHDLRKHETLWLGQGEVLDRRASKVEGPTAEAGSFILRGPPLRSGASR